MTSLQTVYDAFMAKILDDEWNPEIWTQEEIDEDRRQLLDGAIARFKFPRVSLDIETFDKTVIDEETQEEKTITITDFVEELRTDEVQILATYMKCEWLNRSILTWERVKPLYEERDFSEANMLNKLYNSLESEWKNALRLEAFYYRSIKKKPWDYTRLAGDQNIIE